MYGFNDFNGVKLGLMRSSGISWRIYGDLTKKNGKWWATWGEPATDRVGIPETEARNDGKKVSGKEQHKQGIGPLRNWHVNSKMNILLKFRNQKSVNASYKK
jgi:hypothetical protein